MVNNRVTPSIGEILKFRREELGLSIDDVHIHLKMTPTFLRALEENNFSILPGTVFTKAFIKTYGDFLGLNGSELSHQYEDQYLTPSAPVTHSSATITPSRRRQMIIVASVFFISIACALLYYFSWHKNQTVSPAPTLTIEEEIPVIVPDTQSDTIPTSHTTEADTVINPDTTKLLSHPADSPRLPEIVPGYHELQIKINDSVWVAITLDSMEPIYKLFTVGQDSVPIAYRFKKQAQLIVGNAGGLSLIINRKDTLAPVGASGKRVDVLIDSIFLENLKKIKN